MADQTANHAAPEQRVSRVMVRVAWLRAHRRVVATLCLALIVAIFAVDLGGRRDDWVLSVFYLLPLSVLAVTLRRPRLVAVIGVACIAATITDAAIELENIRVEATLHAFVVFLALATVALVELTSFITQIDEVSRRALVRAHLAAADAEIVALGTRNLDLDELLGLALERACTEVGAIAGLILTLRGDAWIVQATFGVRTIATSTWLPVEALSLPEGAFDSPEPFVIRDIAPALAASEAAVAREIESLDLAVTVAVPMVAFRSRRGIILLGRTPARGPLAPEESRFVTDVAGHLAATIENAELIMRLGSRERSLSLVLDSSLDFAASLDPREVIKAVVKRLADALSMDSCDLHVVEEPERTSVRTVVSYDGGQFDEAPFVGKSYTLEEFTSTAYVIRTRKPLSITDFSDERLSPRERELLAENGQASQFTLPLVVSERVIGVVELFNRGEARDPDRDEVELAEAICRFAALALDNAQLFERAESRNQALRDLVELGSLVATAEDADEMLRRVAKRLREALELTNVDIFVLEGDQLWSRVSYDRDGYDDEAVGHYLAVEEYPETSRQAIETGRPVVVRPSERDQLSDRDRGVYEKWGFVCNATIPMIVEGRIRGVFDVYDERPRDFNDDVDFLTAVGALAAASLEKHALLQRVTRANVRLRDLVEIGALVSAAKDADEMLRALAKRLHEALDAFDVDIFLLDGDQLWSKVSYDRNGYDKTAVGHSLRVEEYGTTRRAFETKSVAIVRPSEVGELSTTERSVFEEYGFACTAAIPMIVEGRIQGVIDIYDDRPRDFHDDLDFLSTVGTLTAAALEKQILLEQVTLANVRLRELVELGAVVWRSRDVDTLVRQVAQRLVRATGATCCELYRLDRGALRCAVDFHVREGFDDAGLGRPLRLLDYPITAAAIDRREPLTIIGRDDERLTDGDRRMFEESGFESELCVPLVVEDRIVGLLDIYDERRRDFSSSLDFLVTAGQMIAGAFDNVALLDRLDRTNRELEALVDSSLEFGSTLELDRVLVAIASRIREVANAMSCDIYALDEGIARGLVSVGRDGPDESFPGEVWDVSLYSVRGMLLDNEPIVISDRDHSDLITDHERREWLAAGFVSALRLPLLSRGRLYGWITLFDDRVREYERIGFLRGLAQLAAQAVINASLFAELDASTRRLQQVNEASLDLSSTLSLETVLYATAERLCDVAGAPCCDIYTFEAGDLVCRASVKDGAVSVGWVGTRVSLGEWGSDALAIETRTTIVLAGADDPQRSAAEIASLKDTGFESQLTVPLLAADRVIGVVQLLDRRRGRTFAAETVATVEAITRAAALAIGNAELFDSERETSARLERLAAQLQSLQEISLRLNRLRDQEAVLDEVLRGGARLLGVERAAYAVRDGEVVQLEAFHSVTDPELLSESEAEAALATLSGVLPSLSLAEDTPAGVEAPIEQRAVLYEDSLVVPLRRHRADAVAALVFTEKLDGSSFGAEEERLATTLAAQLSLTLRNVQAYQREHEIAEEFQNALLETPPAIDGATFGVRYVPAGQVARVGGDFYDFVQLGPQRFMVAIGDVCGRGLAAAVQTAMVRYMLRAYVAESSPGEALARLNATMAAQAPEMPFLTMAVAYVDVARGSFDYAVAGHPRPLVFSGGDRLDLPGEGSFPVGVFPSSVYPTNRSVLSPGATVILFTDGLTEARRNDVQIREAGLERMVRRHLADSPQKLADTLIARALRYGGEALDDDMAVVVVRLAAE